MYDAWCMMHDTWYMIHDKWYMTHNTLHMTHDTWHMTHYYRFLWKVNSFDFAFPMSGYIVIHVAIEKGTETESRPKMSVICESIFQIEKAKWKNLITMSEFLQSQCWNLLVALPSPELDLVKANSGATNLDNWDKIYWRSFLPSPWIVHSTWWKWC